MELLTFRRMLEIAHLHRRRGWPIYIVMFYLCGLVRGARFYHYQQGEL